MTHPASYTVGTRVCFCGDESHQSHEADRLPLSPTKIRNDGAISPFIVWCLINSTDHSPLSTTKVPLQLHKFGKFFSTHIQQNLRILCFTYYNLNAPTVGSYCFNYQTVPLFFKVLCTTLNTCSMKAFDGGMS